MKRAISFITFTLFLFNQLAFSEAAYLTQTSHLRTPAVSDGSHRNTPIVKSLETDLAGQGTLIAARDGGGKLGIVTLQPKSLLTFGGLKRALERRFGNIDFSKGVTPEVASQLNELLARLDVKDPGLLKQLVFNEEHNRRWGYTRVGLYTSENKGIVLWAAGYPPRFFSHPHYHESREYGYEAYVAAVGSIQTEEMEMVGSDNAAPHSVYALEPRGSVLQTPGDGQVYTEPRGIAIHRNGNPGDEVAWSISLYVRDTRPENRGAQIPEFHLLLPSELSLRNLDTSKKWYRIVAQDGGEGKGPELQKGEVTVPRKMPVDVALRTLFQDIDPDQSVLLRLVGREERSSRYEEVAAHDFVKKGEIVAAEPRGNLYVSGEEEIGLVAPPFTQAKLKVLLNQISGRKKTLHFFRRRKSARMPRPPVEFVWLTTSKTIYLHQIRVSEALSSDSLAALEAIVTKWHDPAEENVPTAARQKYGEAFRQLEATSVTLENSAGKARDGGEKVTVERTPHSLMSYLHTLLGAGTVTYHPDEKEGNVVLEWSLRDGEPDRLRFLFIPKHLTEAKAILRAVILRLSSERLHIPKWHAEDSPIDALKKVYAAWEAEDEAAKTASDGGAKDGKENQTVASIPERARYLRTEYGEHLRMRSSGVLTTTDIDHDLNLVLTVQQFYGGVHFTDLVRQYGPEIGNQVERAIQRIERSASRIDDLIGKGKPGTAQAVREEATFILESLRFLSNVGNGEFAEDGGRRAAPLSPFRQDVVFYP